MSFFENKSVNLLNSHTVLRRFAASVVEVFGMVFLYKQGIPIHIVLMMWASVYVIRFFIRPLSFLLQRKIGLKGSLILGTITYAGVFPILSQVDGVGPWFIAFIVYWAISDTFYWLPYHAYYASMGDSKNRGKHVSIREGASMIVAAIAPITGGFLIFNFGFWSAYLLATVAMFFAITPVLMTKGVSPGKDMTMKKAMKEIDKTSLWLLFGDGILFNLNGAIWPIVLYFLVKDVMIVGGIFTVEMIFIAGLSLFLGNLIDKGKGRKVFNIASILFALVVLGRGLYVYDIKTILSFEALAALMVCFYGVSTNAVLYNASKKSQNTHWFHLFGEAGWDLGAIVGLGFASLWTMNNFELRYAMPFAILGMLIVRNVMYTYYKKIIPSSI